MSSRYRDGRVVGPVIEPATRVESVAHQLPGLTRLAELLLMSRARGEEPSERAALPADLRPFGLSLDDLRELLTRGLITCIPTRKARESGTKARSSPHRGKPRILKPPAIGIRTPFILTDAGLAFATKHSALAAAREPSPSGRSQGDGGIASAPIVAGSLREPSAREPAPIVAGSLREPSAREPSPSGRSQAEGGIEPSPLVAGSLREPSARDPSHSGRSQGEGSIEPSPSGRGQGEGGLPTKRSSTPSSPPISLPSSPLLHYDIESRELSVAGEVIVRLRLQAHNLTAVLTALQLAGWPPRIVKPLNGYPDASDPQHLADAVYGLNHRQSLIEFRTDGPAIRWQWRSTQDASGRSRGANSTGAVRSRKRR